VEQELHASSALSNQFAHAEADGPIAIAVAARNDRMMVWGDAIVETSVRSDRPYTERKSGAARAAAEDPADD
jgi:hypothetical protein